MQALSHQLRGCSGCYHSQSQRMSSPVVQAQLQACSSSSSAGSSLVQRRVMHRSFSSCSRPPKPARVLVRTHAQGEKRIVRITVAGPPDQPPRTIEVDDPQVVPADVLSFNQIQHELQARQAGVSKSEAREQAAIIQAQRQEISSLRQALAETQDVMLKGKQTYNQVMHTKDLQIAQLYELAASGVRERAKLRQEVNEVQQELQGTRRQLHAFMSSLMQLKNSMASAGEGDLEHALELLQSSSYSASLNSAAQFNGTNLSDDEVMAQLQQMQQLSETLVQDMRQDEALLSQGLAATRTGGSNGSTSWDFDSIDSVDMYGSSGGSSASSVDGWRQGGGRQGSNGSSGGRHSSSEQQHHVPPSNGSSEHGGSSGGGSNGSSGKSGRWQGLF